MVLVMELKDPQEIAKAMPVKADPSLVMGSSTASTTNVPALQDALIVKTVVSP
jgi:hypothetical protein